MKNIILAFILITCLVLFADAQDSKPEKVYSIVKVQYEYDWYTQQHDLWKKALKANPKDADGWLSYYTTTRMAKILAPDDATRNDWYKKMGEIVAEMKQPIKGTYEYYYIQGYHEEDKSKGIEYTFKAYELDPTRPDTYDGLVSHYELKRDKAKLKEVCTNWNASGDLSPTLLAWNYNMLVSTKKNAILITFGDNDTYPAWVLQYAKNVRTDVTVINSSLILLEDYRNALFKELGIPEMDAENIRGKMVFEHIVKHKGDRPLYTGIAGNHAALGLSDQLFNVGLAMLYSEEEINTTSYLIKNFEDNILLDHLKCMVYTETFPSAVNRYNLLYIPGMMMLYKHYILIDDVRQQSKIKNLILNISSGSSQEAFIQKQLEEYQKLAYK